MTAPLHIVILAAGMGSRMHSSRPKVLHLLAGKPLLAWVIETARTLNPEKIHIVYGHGAEQLKASIKENGLHWVYQAEQAGTAHALAQALPEIPEKAFVLVLAGDVPLIQHETLARLKAVTTANQTPTLGLLLADLPNPFGYGRVIRDRHQNVIEIVEEKDASHGQRLIREIYTGTCLADCKTFKTLMPQIQPNNAQHEFYLTQVVELASKQAIPIHTVQTKNRLETQGVNTRKQLATLERHWQEQQAELLLDKGVTLADPARIDIRGRLLAEPDVFIDVNVVFEGEVTLKKDCHIGPNCVIKDSIIEPGAHIHANSVLEGAHVGAQSTIGPFARLRPGTILEADCKVGNFVETKNIHMKQASKASHLTYLGDAKIGKEVNIGAGTITCNYDGVNKNHTQIDDGAFIGSGTQLVAPVHVGENATIGAGTTLRADAPPHALALTARELKVLKNWQRPEKKK